MTNLKTHIAALEWQLEAGVDIAVANDPVDSTAMPERPKREDKAAQSVGKAAAAAQGAAPTMAAHEAHAEAVRIAKAAATLDELRTAIAAFDGIGLKKTATNLVFGDGNPKAQIMLIGDMPGADEDRQGLPFAGANLKLLDKMFAAIGLDRNSEDVQNAVYVANILNFRPPGNRTPTPAEISLSLPFIEKHIALVAPKILIFMGGITGKTLLQKTEGISKLRGNFHEYTSITEGLHDNAPAAIPALVTHHASALLANPAQKKQAWMDLLMFQQKFNDITTN